MDQTSSLLPGPSVTLRGAVEMPRFGFGTYKVEPGVTERVVSEALEVGYRLIDTATMYGNEAEVGRVLESSGLPREEVFVTTKLNNPDVEPQQVRDAFARSLDWLGLEQVDLYLIHWPMANTTDYISRWRTVCEFLHDGRARAIGVSNFQPQHLRAIIDATTEVPAVNQVEVTPYLTQDEVRQVDAELGVVTQAWSPLARGTVLDDFVVGQVAQRLDCTPAQAVLAWHLARGESLVVKSSSRERMVENAGALAVVDRMDDEAMEALTGLNRDERSGSGPDDVEFGDR